MAIIFKKLRYQNLLSTGNTFTEIDLNRNKATLVVGKNGMGKCLDGSTKVVVKTPSGYVAEVTIYSLLLFYNGMAIKWQGPLQVQTRFGWKTILDVACTAQNSEVYELTTSSGKTLLTSPDHLLWSSEKWVPVKELQVGDLLLNDRGNTETVTKLTLLDYRSDLYDLCVDEVHEFFANGIVSHNSSFIDALTYALYGKPFRAINKPQLINSITGKNLVVELEFTIGKNDYIVRRGMKPNIFEIYQNGKILNQQAGLRDDQDYLENTILRLNYKSFSQIVVLGSANYVPFMQLPASQRRAVVEDLLDIQVFSIMNTLLKEKANVNKQDAKDTDYEIDICQSKIDLQQKHLDQLKANNEELIEQRNAKISEHETSITIHRSNVQKFMDRVNELSEQIADYDKVVDRKQKLVQLESSLEDRIRKLKKEVKFFHDNENCPTCRQGIDHDFRQSTISTRSSKIEEVKEAMQKLELEIENNRARFEEIQKINNEILELNKYIQSNNEQIKFLNRYIRDLYDEIDELKAASQKILEDSEDIAESQKLMRNLQQRKKRIAEERAMYEVAAQLLKDGGIKTKIIRQFIPVMNKLINKYLAHMDFMCDFNLDESFNETIRSRYRDIFSYASFSEGEKMRLNIAIMLAWRAIAKIRNSAATNLLIMDEVLDSSLDGNAHDNVLDMIEKSGEDQNIFIISHSDRVVDKFEHVITFEKHGNFSRIAQ